MLDLNFNDTVIFQTMLLSEKRTSYKGTYYHCFLAFKVGASIRSVIFKLFSILDKARSLRVLSKVIEPRSRFLDFVKNFQRYTRSAHCTGYIIYIQPAL